LGQGEKELKDPPGKLGESGKKLWQKKTPGLPIFFRGPKGAQKMLVGQKKKKTLEKKIARGGGPFLKAGFFALDFS